MLKYYALTILFFALVFTLLFWALNKCNLKKKKRPMQIFSLFVLSIGVLLSMLFLSNIIKVIDTFLQLEFMRKVTSFVFGATKPVVLTGVVLAILLLSIIFLIAGLVVKKICNTVLKHIRIPQGRYNPFAVIIRAFYDTDNGCFTRPHTVVYRKWLLWSKYCVVAVFAITNIFLLTMIFYYPSWAGNNSDLVENIIMYLYWISVVSYLLINEAYYFLRGFDIDDEDYDYETEELSSVIVGSYAKMVQVYNSMASDANLIKVYSYDSTFSNSMFNGGKSSHTAMIDPQLRPVFDMIENSIKISGVDICEEYANALVQMLNGKDIFVSDSIIGEISQYLFNYLNYQLCCGHKVVILCRTEIYDDRARRKQYIEMIRKNLANINGYGSIWQVGTYSSILNNEQVDVLLSSFNQYISDYAHRANSKFFDNVRICVCADCMELLSDEQIYKKALISHFKNSTNHIQFVFLTENNSVMLKDAVSDMMGTKRPVEFFKNSNRLKDVFVFLWRGESYYKPQIIFDTDSKYYYGSALPLGIIAAKYGVEKVNIINCEQTPHRTYHRAMKDRSAEIESAIRSSINFDTFFSYDYINYYITNDLVFLIVFDRYHNAAICKDIWGKIADNKTKILHIISEPYLLREFLCNNIDDTQIAEAIVPFNDVAFKRSEAEALIINMFEFGVKMSRLKSIRTTLRLGDRTLSVTDVIRELFVLAFPDEVPEMCFSSFVFEDDIQFVSGHGQVQDHYDADRIVRFINKDLYEKLISNSEYAKVVLNNNDDWRCLPVLKKDIHNYYLEDQHMSVDGESVLITEIKDGVIMGKLDTETYHFDYAPVVRFSSKDFTLIDDDYAENALLYLRYCTCEATRDIIDYYSLLRGRNLTDPVNCKRYGLNITDQIHETICDTKALVITLNHDFSNNAHMAALFAELLNGLFKTIFPTMYQNIIACANTDGIIVNGSKDDNEDSSDSVKSPDFKALKKIVDMIPCDTSTSTEACVVTVYEFCHKELGMAYELKTRFTDILLLLQRYINWELNHSNKESYLKYGYEDYPDIFPLEELKEYLDLVIPHNISLTNYNTKISLSEWAHCDYCFKPILLTAHKLSDNRLMCNDCFQCRIRAKQEIEELFVEVIKFMNNRYGIQIVKTASDGTVTISVNFKRRTTINRECDNKSPFSVILGFYSADRRELWVERGGPKPATFAILAHELTHAWQNDVFDMKPPESLVNKVVKINGITDPVKIKDIHIWEGHATYVEIQIMRLNNQHEYADFLESEILSRSDDDVYKIGYLYFTQLLKSSGDDNIFEFLLEEGSKEK